jgi:tRNA A37 threonylcarbamoyladenosine dehydratase
VIVLQQDDERFRGVAQLLGESRFGRLRRARFMIVGIGGVGSWVAEGLARSGAGAVALWDLDDICLNNTNRQIHTTTQTIGRLKVGAMRERILDIHPQCDVSVLEDFYTTQTSAALTAWAADGLRSDAPCVVVDAIDSVGNKAALVAQCLRHGLALVTCGSAGGRGRPWDLRVGTLGSSHSDPLLRDVRKRLRKEWSLAPLDYADVSAVYSTESVVAPEDQGATTKSGARRMDCAGGMGSAVYVTASMGLFAVERAVALAVGPGATGASS